MTSKFTLLYFCFIVLAGSATAQPTLTANTNLPVPGFTELIYSEIIATPPGLAGPNVSWDFSAMNFSNNADTIVYEGCNNTNDCSGFPGSNIVAHEPGTSAYGYYTGNTGRLSYVGYTYGGDTVLFSDPEDMLRFPMTYNSQFVSLWACKFIHSNSITYNTGIDSVKADAWGTLKTRAGTYNNVLRIKVVQSSRDSIHSNGAPVVSNHNSIIYTWYDAAHKDYLYSTTTDTDIDSGATVLTFSSYSDHQTLTVPQAGLNAQDWKISPNPARETAQVSISLAAPAVASLQLIDLSGRLLYQSNDKKLAAGENTMSFPVTDIAAGTYMVKLTADGAATFKKIVVAP